MTKIKTIILENRNILKILQYLNTFCQLLKMFNYLCKLIINLKCCYYYTLEYINYYFYHFNTGYNLVQFS